jgi:hypothetical protein
MGLDFFGFDITTNSDISFSTKVPELEIDTEIFPIEQPEIEIPDQFIEDTFQSSSEIPQLSTPPTDPTAVEQKEQQPKTSATVEPEKQPSETQAQTSKPQQEDTFTTVPPDTLKINPSSNNPFTTMPIDLKDPNIKWSVVEFPTDAFKFDPNAFKDVDYEWINSANAKLEISKTKFTDLYKIDGFEQKDPNQFTFEEMKSASATLNAKQDFLNDSQKATLSALTKDINNIETIASKNNVAPEQVLQDLLKNEPEKYGNYFKFINAAKEQVTAGKIAEFVGNDGIRRNLFDKEENKTIKEFTELSAKLKENKYTSADEKAQDLIKLVRLQSKIEKSIDFNSEDVKNIKTEVKDMLVKQMEDNKKLIQASLDELPAAYDKRIKELREKKDLSQEEKATLARYEENREKVLKLVEKAKNSGFSEFANSYSELIMEIQKTDPERAQELLTGIVKGKVAPEIFAESIKNKGNKEDKEAATGILHDIYTDKVLAERLKVSSKDKDSQMRRIGFDSLVKDLNLSQTTAESLKAEMRELYRDDPRAYDYYYNSSSSSNYSEEQALTSSVYTKDEISLLSKIDQEANRGVLTSVAASNETLRTFMKETGISSETLARLMLNDDREGLKQYRKETSSQVA